MRSILLVILVIAIGGLAFSGYLSFRELFGSPAEACAPLGEPGTPLGTVLGTPPCIYGFVMYLAIAVLTIIALARRAAH